jgi:hypothetical protein
MYPDSGHQNSQYGGIYPSQSMDPGSQSMFSSSMMVSNSELDSNGNPAGETIFEHPGQPGHFYNQHGFPVNAYGQSLYDPAMYGQN